MIMTRGCAMITTSQPRNPITAFLLERLHQCQGAYKGQEPFDITKTKVWKETQA